MSKNNRKERKVNTLSDLSTVVDRETLPVTGLHPVSDDQLPEETGAPLPETEETKIHPVEEVIPDEPVTDAVAETIAESSTVEEVAEAFVEPVAQTHEVRVQPEVEHPEDLPNEPPSPEPDPIDPPSDKVEEIPAVSNMPERGW